jgi:hypothetical protein
VGNKQRTQAIHLPQATQFLEASNRRSRNTCQSSGICSTNMGVSINGGTPKRMVYNGTFMYKWMIWGYPHDLGNLHCAEINGQKCGWPSTRPLPLSNHQAGCSPNLNATWLYLKIGCIVPKWIQLAILIAGYINQRISGYPMFTKIQRDQHLVNGNSW